MGILTPIQGERIYLDTNIWIHMFEDVGDFSQALTALFNAIDTGTFTAITSELTLAEVLVKPIQNNNTAQQEIYAEALTSTDTLSVIPIERSILVQAAQIRGTTKLKLPDAIHVATAISNQCTTLLTNDKQLQNFSALPVVLLSQLTSEK
ncbi:MAG: type II toxin-antitoxin system VapC family toxin [Cyanothece sp. SIO1E1]|nr:type II toxin-antitoxin system VapC family toxin [Cyanothece sp. SIO1E1]